MKNLLINSLNLAKQFRLEFDNLSVVEKLKFYLDLEIEERQFLMDTLENLPFVPDWATDGFIVAENLGASRYYTFDLEELVSSFADTYNLDNEGMVKFFASFSVKEMNKTSAEYHLYKMLEDNIGSFIYDW